VSGEKMVLRFNSLFCWLFCCLLLTSCNSLFYFPDRDVYLTPDKVGYQYEKIHIPQGDTYLSAWKILAKREPKLGTILHFHGNAQNMTAHFLFVAWLSDLGFDVLTFDYRGYGESPGKAEREGIFHDAMAAVTYAEQHSDKFYIIAQSIGGAIAVPAVAEVQPKKLQALVIESSFSSYRSIARSKLSGLWLTWPLQWPLSFLVGDSYSPQDYAARIKVPTLVLHGGQDPVVPIEEGEKLARAFPLASVEFWVLPDYQHTEVFSHKDESQKLVEWLLYTSARSLQ
jgi:alpha-beta hydrolase superfamily lysophospholipase